MQTENRAVMNWLFLFAFIVAFLLSLGICPPDPLGSLDHRVESDQRTIPPLGEQAWQEEFAKYQQTPNSSRSILT